MDAYAWWRLPALSAVAPSAPATPPAPYWAVAQLESQREHVAEHFLKLFGFAVYVPRVRERRTYFRRPVEMGTPLFRGYGFVRIEAQWHNVKQCPGVIRLVRSGGDEPVHVPDAIIDALRQRERDGAIDPPSKRGLKAGDRVHIVTGLFTGRFGHCTEISREHIGVLLHMLGAQRRVRLRVDAVELAESQRTRRRAIP